MKRFLENSNVGAILIILLDEKLFVLVGHIPGNVGAELEELTKFWARRLKINDVNQLVQTYSVSSTAIRKDKVQLSNGQFAIRSQNGNRKIDYNRRKNAVFVPFFIIHSLSTKFS